jgi:mono/diheme cytochrome c family protein
LRSSSLSRDFAIALVFALILGAVAITLRVMSLRILAPGGAGDAVSFEEPIGRWVARGEIRSRGAQGLALEMTVLDSAGSPPTTPILVGLILTMRDHPMVPIRPSAQNLGEGRYRADFVLPMAGRWNLTITVPDGVATVTIGPAAPVVDRPNPIPSTISSLTVGERIYKQQCEVCHGVIGAGDGPAAAGLRPRPVDLRVHVAAGHSDGFFFYWISEGFRGTAMPAFKNVLSIEERWHVVNFIKTFAVTDR